MARTRVTFQVPHRLLHWWHEETAKPAKYGYGERGPTAVILEALWLLKNSRTTAVRKSSDPDAPK